MPNPSFPYPTLLCPALPFKLFEDKHHFNDDISKWNVSNVTAMGSMFQRAYVFDQNIGDWDVSSVTILSRMFCDAKIFNQAIGRWQVRYTPHARLVYVYNMLYSSCRRAPST